MIKRVLVVDDEVEITAGLVALFELEEIAACGASDRESAEQLLASEFYPVILADLRLRTEEDGLKLLESVRAISPRSKIATMTAYATAELEAELQRRGSSVVLHKPIAFEEIIAVVSEMLSEIEREASEQQQRTGGAIDLAQLYADVQKILHSIAQRRFRFSPEESEELAQEAWCLFLQKQQSIQLPRPWLAGTIVNLCKQQIHYKTRNRESHQEVSSEAESMVDMSGSSYDTRIMIQRALARMDERSRKLCVLIGMEGWSYQEVAEELSLPVGSVGPLYIRAKNRLRRVLQVSTSSN